jgi:hypothetical protein
MLPILGNSIHEFKNLEQCFVGDKEFPGEYNKLYCLFRIEREQWFNDYVKFLKSHAMYERDYNVNEDYIMFVYNLEGENADRYKNFIKGKYSKLDESYKTHILNFYNIGYGSEVAKVLYRREDKYVEWEKRLGVKIPRDQEIGNMPDFGKEVFDNEKMFIIDNTVSE